MNDALKHPNNGAKDEQNDEEQRAQALFERSAAQLDTKRAQEYARFAAQVPLEHPKLPSINPAGWWLLAAAALLVGVVGYRVAFPMLDGQTESGAPSLAETVIVDPRGPARGIGSRAEVLAWDQKAVEGDSHEGLPVDSDELQGMDESNGWDESFEELSEIELLASADVYGIDVLFGIVDGDELDQMMLDELLDELFF